MKFLNILKPDTLFAKAPSHASRSAFDPTWYLKVNSDVMAAGLDPWEHYTRYGAREGRAAAPLRAFELDHILWRGFAREAEAELRQIIRTDNVLQRAAAGWILARYAAAHGKWKLAHSAIRNYISAPAYARCCKHPGPWLLAVQAAARAEQPRVAFQLHKAATQALEGKGLFGAWRSQGAHSMPMTPAQINDLVFAKMEASIAQGTTDKRLSRQLTRLYADTGCVGLALGPVTDHRFDRLEASVAPMPVPDGPLVSVVVPAYNASATIGTCLRGLSAQSWRNLEVIVVDDCSTDATAEIVKAASERDPRIRLIRQDRNGGAYLARNSGLDAARGEFFTVHDADDWSHPQKIERQAGALINQPNCMASISHWVRTDPDLRMSRWRMEEGWIYRNISSLMIRRAEMGAALGYWDRVRANADTEYYHRLRRAFGESAITEVLPGIPLSFGRSHTGALTLSANCHLATQFIGPRRSYMDAAEDWHGRRVATLPVDASPSQKATALYLSNKSSARPFFAPPEIGPADPNPKTCRYSNAAASGFIDPLWYLRRHADILAADVDPVAHYLEYGAEEDRDPGPVFATAAWRQALRLDENTNPLLEVIAHSPNAHRPPALTGALADMDAPIALVFAHSAEREVFGAERSLLLTLERLGSGYDGSVMAPVVVLPKAVNQAYVDAVCARAKSVEILPQVWRHRFRTPPSKTISDIREMIRRHHVAEVHVNTITLDAPLQAAKLEGCPSVIHVRELPPQDSALCSILGDTANGLHRYVMRAADKFTANSQAVADWLDCPERVSLWPNRVDPALAALPFDPKPRLRVGLISSNIIKKGIGDFCRVAEYVGQAEQAARLSQDQCCQFILIGPDTADLEALLPFPENVVHSGYANDPAAALVQCDLVLVLSHFAESFGRTALEALTAGRPVICYDRGTPPQFVKHFNCGVVVAPDDVFSVAKEIFKLAGAREKLAEMSVQARERARQLAN